MKRSAALAFAMSRSRVCLEGTASRPSLHLGGVGTDGTDGFNFPPLSTINWFPGHMSSASKAIKEKINSVKLIIEVRDARMPLTSANPELLRIIRRKERLVVLNKMDLADASSSQRICEELQERGVTVIPISAKSGRNVKNVVDFMKARVSTEFKTASNVVMVVGMPNVGKSSLINTFRKLYGNVGHRHKTKVATVGPLPGVTRSLNAIKITNEPQLYVLDTPGVLVPQIDSPETGFNLSLLGCIKDDAIGEAELAEYMLYVLNKESEKKYVQALSLQGPTRSFETLINAVMRQSGGMGKQRENGLRIASRYLLKRFRRGEFGRMTLDST